MKASLTEYLERHGIRDVVALKNLVFRNKRVDAIRRRQAKAAYEDAGAQVEELAAQSPEERPDAECAREILACLDRIRAEHPQMVGLFEAEWARLSAPADNGSGKALTWEGGANSGLNVSEAMRRSGMTRDKLLRAYGEFRSALHREFSRTRRMVRDLP